MRPLEGSSQDHSQVPGSEAQRGAQLGPQQIATFLCITLFTQSPRPRLAPPPCESDPGRPASASDVLGPEQGAGRCPTPATSSVTSNLRLATAGQLASWGQ